MGRLKSKEAQKKIDGKISESQGCCSEQYPWFSFKSITHNANYNLSKLAPGTERDLTLWGLYSKLRELSEQPWIYWLQMRKTTGLETLSYHQLNFSAAPEESLSKDTTVYVFRFDTHLGAGKGRIIGFKKTPCSVFHIIGFDLDFSAYSH